MPAHPISVAIVGLGKIARDQHVPAIEGNPAFELAGVASRNASLPSLRHFSDIGEMLRNAPDIAAVSLCTPPQGRQAQAQAALAAGRHVLLEKPPGATVAEIGPLIDLARQNGVTLFATWHSRFAAAVEPARAFLADARIRSVQVTWKEDVRHWHPGQQWIWEPGGLGVFDPGINALSIVTRILPQPFFLTQASLSFPANRAAPIAAKLDFADGAGVPVRFDLDWRQTGPQSWDIDVDTDKGRLLLGEGGKTLSLDGRPLLADEDAEYAGIYARFAELIEAGESEVDLSPLVHVADAFMLGRRIEVEPFEDAA